tara:strand:+ start:270 stop:995 length:726 start_codon:yes stop_codon:yes gene_type:complete
MAEKIKSVTAEVGIPFIFKASFDKANRSSIKSYRGPGLSEGLEILGSIREDFDVPVLTDIHEVSQISAVTKVVDCVQIPAFLSRQTDLLLAAGLGSSSVNVKKGQFLSPWDMEHVLEKIASTGCDRILLTERGTSFGYNNLIVDIRSFAVMREFGYPVVYDVTHSLQQPGGQGSRSGGQPKFIEYLARAGVAAGVDGLFMELHDNPEAALSDGANALELRQLGPLLRQLVMINKIVKENEP